MTEQPSDRQRDFLLAHPATLDELRDTLGGSRHAMDDLRKRCRKKGYEFRKRAGTWHVTKVPDVAAVMQPTLNRGQTVSDVDPSGDPDPDELTKRERYIVQQLQTGSSFAELEDDLDTRESVIAAHLRNIKEQGWQVYIDQSTDTIGIEGDEPLRSSEHTGTRTRIANKWWQMRHNELVRAFKTLEAPTAKPVPQDGDEDWVTHLTDLHAGDEVRDEDGNVVYSTDRIPSVVEYVTEQSLTLADKHGSSYDTAYVLWGGDFITNEGIYAGQFEDLDAWLDEQHDALIDPLVASLKAFAERFGRVAVVCQVGNHGNHRANGTSKQANADLVLYKSIRNVVSQLQEYNVLENVSMQIGQARPYKNFWMRRGKLRGHLRHGQHRRPQAETSAREKEWVKTLLEHDFDVACMGHWHISGRIPWDGPPVICSASPKPPDEFIEEIGGRLSRRHRDLATCFGVSDDGITSVFPVDTRKYDDD
jgi:biotin operon repressor